MENHQPHRLHTTQEAECGGCGEDVWDGWLGGWISFTLHGLETMVGLGMKGMRVIVSIQSDRQRQRVDSDKYSFENSNDSDVVRSKHTIHI